MGDLEVDSDRRIADLHTGIFVRARDATGYGSHDIATLTRASLIAWLRDGGEKRAEQVVLVLLGHSL